MFKPAVDVFVLGSLLASLNFLNPAFAGNPSGILSTPTLGNLPRDLVNSLGTFFPFEEAVQVSNVSRHIRKSLAHWIRLKRDPVNLRKFSPSIAKLEHLFNPNTGVFRNVNRITMGADQLTKEFIQVLPAGIKILTIEGKIKNDEHLLYLQRFSQLEWLDLSSTHVKDISALKDMSSLVVLNLFHTDILEISALRNLVNLRFLDVSETGVQDISVVENFPDLRALKIAFSGVRDLSPLKSLTKINLLEAGSTPIRDLQALSSLISLRLLSVNSSQVRDLRPLQNLSNLEVLEVAGTVVKDIFPLRALTNLKLLDLSSTRIKDISPLYGFSKLEALKLSLSYMSETLSLHQNFPHLKELTFEGMD